MSPRVLMIVENLPVPFDRRVWQEATTLAQNGYDVTVISPTGKGFVKQEEIIDGIQIYRHDLPAEGRGAKGFVIEYAAALYHEMRLALKVWRKGRFAVVHVANPPDILFLVALPFKLFGAKLLFDHHDLTPELYVEKFGKKGFGYQLMRLTEWLTFKFANAVISTNQSYRQIAIERGGKNPDDIFIVRSSPNIKNIRVMEPDPQYRRGASVVLGYVGIMGSQDGIDVLLRILARLVNERGFTDFQAVLIGEGPELADSKLLAEKLGIAAYVTFTGYLSGENLHRAMSSVDIGLCPDPYNDYTRRCTMNKIMEYMAFSKPVVQFDLDEGRYSAQDASLYARAGDEADFADKLMVLIRNPHLREEMGALGRSRIENVLNWQNETPKLLAAYERMLGPRPVHGLQDAV